MKIIKRGLNKEELKNRKILGGVCGKCKCIFQCLVDEAEKYNKGYKIKCPNPDCKTMIFNLALMEG